MGVSNRIYTMAQGRITGELGEAEITEENLMRNIVITDSKQTV
jgi:ABC-type sugar transport system ATPase subunit